MYLRWKMLGVGYIEVLQEPTELENATFMLIFCLILAMQMISKIYFVKILCHLLSVNWCSWKYLDIYWLILIYCVLLFIWSVAYSPCMSSSPLGISAIFWVMLIKSWYKKYFFFVENYRKQETLNMMTCEWAYACHLFLFCLPFILSLSLYDSNHYKVTF